MQAFCHDPWSQSWKSGAQNIIGRRGKPTFGHVNQPQWTLDKEGLSEKRLVLGVVHAHNAVHANMSIKDSSLAEPESHRHNTINCSTYSITRVQKGAAFLVALNWPQSIEIES
jgi:hypothetical protein